MLPMSTAEERAKRAAYMREWHRRNPRRRKHYLIKGRYGLTIDDFEAIVEAQDGRCAVCLRVFDPDPQKRDMQIDHNHETGVMRGVVCARCNAILGRVDRDVEVLKRAVAYLERVR
jgi:hypothetical protein